MSPDYRWRCHKCELGNESGRTACAHCGFPAIASAVEIAAARNEPNPIRQGYSECVAGAGWGLLELLGWMLAGIMLS